MAEQEGRYLVTVIVYQVAPSGQPRIARTHTEAATPEAALEEARARVLVQLKAAESRDPELLAERWETERF